MKQRPKFKLSIKDFTYDLYIKESNLSVTIKKEKQKMNDTLQRMEKNEHTMIHDPHSEKTRQSFNSVTGQKIRHTIKTTMDLASKKKNSADLNKKKTLVIIYNEISSH